MSILFIGKPNSHGFLAFLPILVVACVCFVGHAAQDTGKLKHSANYLGLVPHWHVSILVRPPKPMLNKAMRLTCHSHGQYSPHSIRYEWFVNNVPRERSSTLKIDYATAEVLSSTYECRAVYNGLLQTAIYRPKSMLLKNYVAYEVRIRANPVQPKLYQPWTLSCNINITSSNVTYTWYVNSQPATSGSYFSKIRMELDDFGKVYLCHVNVNGIYRYATAIPYIQQLLKDPIVLESTPGLVYGYHVGETQELHCELGRIRSSPASPKDAVWYFDGQRMDLQETFNRKDKLLSSIVTILNATEKHKGRYECAVMGIKQEVSLLPIDDRVSMHVYPNELIVSEGSPSEFHCRIPSTSSHTRNNRNELKWYYMGDDPLGKAHALSNVWSISKNDQTAGSVFIQMNRTRGCDEGYYRCQPDDGSYFVYTLLLVKEMNAENLLRVLVRPPHLEVRPSQPFNLTCESLKDGLRFGFHQWTYTSSLHQGKLQQMRYDSRFTTMSYGIGFSTLYVSGLQISEDGMKFVCQVDNTESKAVISVKDDTLKVIVNPPTIKAKVSMEYTLNCKSLKGGLLYGQHEWIHQRVNGYEEKISLNVGARFRFTQHSIGYSELVIKTFRMSDDNSKVICRVGRIESYSLINVYDESYYVNLKPPHLVVRPSEPFNLTCESTRDTQPDGKHQWFYAQGNHLGQLYSVRQENRMSQIQISEGYSVLSVQGLKLSEDGVIFICQVNNNDSRATIRVKDETLKVVVTPPVIQVKPSTPYQFTCKSTKGGSAYGQHEWFHQRANGYEEKISVISGGRYLIREHSIGYSVLIVQGFQNSDDNTKVICRVDHIEGYSLITVYIQPLRVVVTPPYLVGKPFETFNFTCKSTQNGVNHGRHQWYLIKLPEFKKRILVAGEREFSLASESLGYSNIVIRPNGNLLGHFKVRCEDGNVADEAKLVVNEDYITVNVTPSQLTVRPHRPITISCVSMRDTDIHVQHYWTYKLPNMTYSEKMEYSKIHFVERKIQVGYSILTIDGLDIHLNGVIFTCHAESVSASSVVNVTDGAIVLCDPLIVPCSTHQGQAPVRHSFNIHWTCDGEEDCGNGFDEASCSDRNCQYNQRFFSCGNGKQVPRGYVCDKHDDCGNGMDENDCQIALVTHPSQHVDFSQYAGSTLELKCTAKGTPIPEIAWRFNWGCLPNYARIISRQVVTECNEVQSTLIISNFQTQDAGIYNCEAINAGGRSMSNDMQVSMRFI